MAFDYECDKIQEFIDAVQELVDAVESEMAGDYFDSEIDDVKDKMRRAESELDDIRNGGGVDVQDALREAYRVRDHLDSGKTDLDDCITALEG